MGCVFCNKENLTTDIVFEDELVMAFMDIALCKMAEYSMM